MFKNFSAPIQTTLNNIDEIIDGGKGDNVDTKKLMKSFALDIIGTRLPVLYSLQVFFLTFFLFFWKATLYSAFKPTGNLAFVC